MTVGMRVAALFYFSSLHDPTDLVFESGPDLIARTLPRDVYFETFGGESDHLVLTTGVVSGFDDEAIVHTAPVTRGACGGALIALEPVEAETNAVVGMRT